MPTQFSQGGLNVYEDGWVGWMGLGGSLLQWHPGLNISFAFVPTFLDWSDLDNARAKTLQVLKRDYGSYIEWNPFLEGCHTMR